MGESLDYAREVYAACATIGFRAEPAMTLKRLLDQRDAGGEVTEADLIGAAQRAHLAAANWAGRQVLGGDTETDR